MKTLYLDKVHGFDAPFPRHVWESVTEFMRGRILDYKPLQKLRTPQDFLTMRKDLDALYSLGALIVKPSVTKGKRTGRFTEDKFKFEFSMRFLGWMVFFPDYLLVAYPLKPPTVGDLLVTDCIDSANPTFYRPCKLWGLPQYVYDWADAKYGEDPVPPKVPKGLQQFNERKEYLYTKVCTLHQLDPNKYATSKTMLTNIVI